MLLRLTQRQNQRPMCPKVNIDLDLSETSKGIENWRMQLLNPVLICTVDFWTVGFVFLYVSYMCLITSASPNLQLKSGSYPGASCQLVYSLSDLIGIKHIQQHNRYSCLSHKIFTDLELGIITWEVLTHLSVKVLLLCI